MVGRDAYLYFGAETLDTAPRRPSNYIGTCFFYSKPLSILFSSSSIHCCYDGSSGVEYFNNVKYFVIVKHLELQ